MKICTLFGDLGADRVDDIYPTDLYCYECFLTMGPDQEDSSIVSYQDDNGDYGDVCSNCGKTRKEETEEKRSM